MKRFSIILLFCTLSLYMQAVPDATDVKVLGSGKYNSAATPDETTVLTGYYWYRDDVNDEAVSTYRWFRDGSEIVGETDIRYTVTSADIGHEITFEVTPVSTVESGTPVTSTSANSVTVSDINDALIRDLTPADDFNATDGGTYEYMNLTLSGDSGQKLNISGGSVVNVYGDLTISNANLGEFLVNGGTLNIYGQLIITSGPAQTKVQNSNNGRLNINSGVNSSVSLAFHTNDTSITDITGNIVITGSGSDIDVNGSLSVDGSFIVGASTNINVEGELTVLADFIGGAGSTMSGNGSANIYGKMEGITLLGPIVNNTETNLPIELVYFRANNCDHGVLLSWQTASEENNDYFTIERSIDGVNYEIISTLDGAGNSSTLLSYTYTDTKAIAGILYYRLKQTDFNGDYSYSDVISGEYTNDVEIRSTEIKAYPSPYKSEKLTITNFGTEDFTTYTINLIDISGKTIYAVHGFYDGSNSISVNPNKKFSKGLYIVTLQTPTTFGKTKLLVE